MRLIVDVDGTLTQSDEDRGYPEKLPRKDVIGRVNGLRQRGAYVLLYTARNMRTYSGDLEKIHLHTLPVLVDWLRHYDVEYDELHLGKPWCGPDGCYVSRNSIRPDDFSALSLDELEQLLTDVAIGNLEIE